MNSKFRLDNRGVLTDSVISLIIGLIVVTTVATYFTVDARMTQKNNQLKALIEVKEDFLEDFYSGKDIFNYRPNTNKIKNRFVEDIKVVPKKQTTENNSYEKYSVEIQIANKPYDDFKVIRSKINTNRGD